MDDLATLLFSLVKILTSNILHSSLIYSTLPQDLLGDSTGEKPTQAVPVPYFSGSRSVCRFLPELSGYQQPRSGSVIYPLRPKSALDFTLWAQNHFKNVWGIPVEQCVPLCWRWIALLKILGQPSSFQQWPTSLIEQNIQILCFYSYMLVLGYLFIVWCVLLWVTVHYFAFCSDWDSKRSNNSCSLGNFISILFPSKFEHIKWCTTSSYWSPLFHIFNTWQMPFHSD